MAILTRDVPTDRRRRVVVAALADLIGAAGFAAGLYFLATDGQRLIGTFPANRAEAWTAIIAGAVLMAWAAASIFKVFRRTDPAGSRSRHAAARREAPAQRGED